MIGNSFPPHPECAEGDDTEGMNYKDIKEMWSKTLAPDGKIGSTSKWYKGGEDYWSAVDADEKGVLGGFLEIGPPDIQTSRELLLKLLMESNIHPGLAIGRSRL